MADSFDERTRFLEQQVGDGHIVAGCTVDQPYAQNQHENRSFSHTVGRAGYLGDPLMENSINFMDRLARSVITEAGSDLKNEMQDIANEMNDFVVRNAPRDPDIGDVLAHSGSPWVDDNGIRTYYRPPRAGRSYDHR